ncbi:MAG: PhzF family phenazine biosynthesis protein [Thermoleophilia bacterium]|nr:PhzF family phenazine biosynthesis protein [Thermoleophilia bacterium]
MELPVVVVDAFTDTPFTGNPAAVCVTAEPLPDDLMQRVAAEMRHSETAFLVPRPDGEWSLRWFTPAVEVDLCGHATLASAHALWEGGMHPACMLTRFHTRSGLLSARGSGGVVWIDLPASPPVPAAAPEGLARWLGAEPDWVGSCGIGLFAAVADPATVRRLRPDDPAVAGFSEHGVIVSAPGEPGSGYDAVSRYFAPGFGIAEDPVTGAAHCTVGPYWAALLGREELRCRQASPRGGDLIVRLRGDRVEIGGRAVTVLRGELVVP